MTDFGTEKYPVWGLPAAVANETQNGDYKLSVS